jgi:nitrous oxide reductase accessory protein NosL
MKVMMGVLLAVLLAVPPAGAQEDPAAFKPSQTDKCPVCGMFVAKYPDFVARITFKDGSYAVFDGAKDMFKYYLEIKKYAPSRDTTDVNSVVVTDYYGLTPIDGLEAFYVLGSNVYGPMGNEFISFQKEDDANEFMADHVGKSILRFQSITADLTKSLD